MQNSDIDQKDSKVAVITGVSKGIGLSSALKLIELGYIVVGCARNELKMKELQQKYSDHDFSKVDVSNASSVEIWAQRIIFKYGSPSLLLLNAGVACDKASIENVSIDNLNKIIDVNVKGVMYAIKYFIGSMKSNKNKISRIIAISSPSGRDGFADMSPYCASKWALEGLMISISKEIGVDSNMLACAYNPGGIITEMIYCLVPELKGKIDECIDMGAIGPKQWADKCIPHILSLTKDQHNGKPVDRPDLLTLLAKNWKIYKNIKQKVIAAQKK